LFSRTAVKDANGDISEIICIAKDMSGYVRVDDEAAYRTKVAGRREAV
jgi:hypothetical protein